MLQRLPIALGQVKVGSKSERLLNEIRQIVYFLYQSKQITRKVITKIRYYIYEFRKQLTSEPHVLVLKHTNNEI